MWLPCGAFVVPFANRVTLKADEMDVVYKVRFLSSPSSIDQIYVLKCVALMNL